MPSMTNVFPKTDLPRVLALPAPTRLLALLAAFRFVALSDLLLAGVDEDHVAAAEAAGQALGFRLQRRMTDREPTRVLALSRAGARALAASLDVEPGSVPYSTATRSARSSQFMDHSLARSAFAVLLGTALAPGRALLSWEWEPERLATSAHVLTKAGELVRRPLVADGIGVVVGPRCLEGVLVEIDRGTESAQKLMGPKYAAYLEWWRSGGPHRRFSLAALRLLTVTPDQKRAERLRSACATATGARGAGLFWFASEENLRREGLLGQVWSTPRGSNLRLWS